MKLAFGLFLIVLSYLVGSSVSAIAGEEYKYGCSEDWTVNDCTAVCPSTAPNCASVPPCGGCKK